MPPPPSLPPLLLLLLELPDAPFLPAVGCDDEDGGGGCGDSLFPPPPPPPPGVDAPLPGARLKEKDDPRTSRLSRLLPPPPLPSLLTPSLPPPPLDDDEEEDEADVAASGFGASGWRVAQREVPRVWGLRTKARPCRQADAACWGVEWIGLRGSLPGCGWSFGVGRPHASNAPAPRGAPP